MLPTPREEPSTRPVAERPASPPRRAWSWTDINFWLDAALLVVFTALCWCSVVVRFIFPPGPSAQGWRLWGADYDQWAGVQFGLIALLALGILVHVMFHWSWVCNVVVSRLGRDRKARVDDGTQTIYGVGLLIVLLNVIGIGVAAAALMIQGPG
jgi:hypothetical protein